MSKKFYFHSIEIENFRTFKSIKIDKLKKINIIGGFNGVGKTTFLESMFFFLDRRNPIALLKPLSWRRYEIQGPIEVSSFLNDQAKHSAYLRCATRNGNSSLELSYGKIPTNISLSMTTGDVPAGFGTIDTSRKGMSIKLYSGGVISEETYLLPAASGAVGNIAKVSDEQFPVAQILSIANRAEPRDTAQRLSALVRDRRVGVLIEALKDLVPDLTGLQTLQEGGGPQIYAEIGSNFLPVQLLGDGFQNLLQTLLGIMSTPGGVLFLDEIDAAVHYSKVTQIWTTIAKLAEAENCQIFATTHSRECINSAAEGVRLAGLSANFQYMRFEKAAEDTHRSVAYDLEDVKDAEVSSVEIR